MALISKSFPQSTRPSLQTLRHSPAPADKSRKARAKTPLMRPSLQTAPRTAVACVAAVAPQGDCSRSTGDACADMRANSRDCVEPTRAAPAPGSRGSRHPSAAWPVASVAVAHVDTSMHCSTSDPGLANAAGTPCRRPHTAASPSPPLSAQGKSEQSAFGAARLQSGCAHVIPGPPHRGAHRPPYYGVIARRSKIKPVESDRVRWVHSREHPRVHSRERQGFIRKCREVPAFGFPHSREPILVASFPICGIVPAAHSLGPRIVQHSCKHFQCAPALKGIFRP